MSANPQFSAHGRHLARLSAVQALYQMELSEHKSKAVLRQFKDHWASARERASASASAGTKTENTAHYEADNISGNNNEDRADSDFFELLVLGVVAEQDIIDTAISGKLDKKWKLSRLDVTLRAIMRCASYEMLRMFDVPALVIIDEYVGLAKDFYAGKEPGFVNAALDKLAREHRPAEFGIIGPDSTSVAGATNATSATNVTDAADG